MTEKDYRYLVSLIDGFIKYIKIQTCHIKTMTEEERFDMITDIESLFYIYVDMYDNIGIDIYDNGTQTNAFIEFIRLHKKEYFNGSAEWQKVFKKIYNNYIDTL